MYTVGGARAQQHQAATITRRASFRGRVGPFYIYLWHRDVW